MYPQNRPRQPRPRSVSRLDLQKEQTARYFTPAVLLAGLWRAVWLAGQRTASNLLGRTGRIWSALLVCPDYVRILGMSSDLDPDGGPGAWDDDASWTLLSHPC